MVLEVHERVWKAKSAVRNPEMTAIVEQRAREGKPVYHLNIGDPAAYGLVPPFLERLRRAKAALSKKSYSYAEAHGIKELREAVARDAQKHGIVFADAEHVVVGQGVSEIVDFLSALSLGPGRNIVVPRPDYYLYSSLARKYGGEVRYYDLEPESGWTPNLGQVKKNIDENTAAVVIINPNNPTGAHYGRKALEKFIKAVKETGKGEVPIISDEIYRHLVFPKGKRRNVFSKHFAVRHTMLASLAGDMRVATLDGVAKGYYAPGERIGHALFTNFERQKDGRLHPWIMAMRSLCATRLAAPHAAQRAYAAAIRGRDRPWNRIAYNRRLAELQKRAEYAADSLYRLGFNVHYPHGAFYLAPRLSPEMRDIWARDEDFVKEILKETGVYVTPLSGFAMHPEDGFFRVVSLPSVKEQKKIFEILGSYISKRLAEAA